MTTTRRLLRVSHVITGLGVGGAEMMLVKLLRKIDRTEFQSHVVALSADTPLASDVQDTGARLDVLGIPPSMANTLWAMPQLIHWLREQRPHLVQTWLFHADLIGGIAARCLRVPVIWNIQTSTFGPTQMSRRMRQIIKACALVSRVMPRAIVSCSWAGVPFHRNLGYCDKFCVIANGIDLNEFKPDADTRHQVRYELNVAADVPVVGMVARFHAAKDIPTFLAAAEDMIRTHPKVRFVLCGRGLETANVDLMTLIRARSLERHTVLAGCRRDVPRIMNAFDVHTLSSSFSEAFPNVLGEAMATAVPCVVTDVGDSSMIVGDTGVVVAPQNPRALADGWRALLDLPRDRLAALGDRARLRVVERFSLTASVAQYEQLYRDVANDRPCCGNTTPI